MDQTRWLRHKLRNASQTLLLVGAMAGLLGALGWLLGGAGLALTALIVVGLLYIFNPFVSPRLILNMYQARPISYSEAPRLYAILETLAERAALPATPALYYLPSDVLNAFALGRRDHSVIALSDGILRGLDLRELAGVLAHEVSHIAHNDISIMGFADLSSRLTRFLSLAGQVLLLLNLPLLLLEGFHFPWLLIAFLILAPSLSALAQLALSRAREYNADLEAARLMGDPGPLASALAKMEAYQGHFFEQILLPGRRLPEPSLLRTHPPTRKRVERLVEMGHRPPPGFRDLHAPLTRLGEDLYYPRLARARLRPRWHINGLWF